MKDLYWCLWTWLLPALAGLLLCAVTQRRGKTPWWCYLLVLAACMVRCMCGFEFISDALDEKEREEFSRLKVIKRTKLKRAQAEKEKQTQAENACLLYTSRCV